MSISGSVGHPCRWLLLFVVVTCLFPHAVYAAQPSTTQIDEVLYRADNTRANGTLLISWPSFVTSDKQSVAAGTKAIAIGTDGRVTVALIPTAGATPTGTVYKVIAKYTDGTTATEFWSIPSTPTATIAQIRVTPSNSSNSSVSSQSLVSGKLDRFGDTPISLAGVRYADAFSGTTATKKLDASIADCGSNPCIVVATPSLGPGMPTTVPDNVVLRDERQWATVSNWGVPDLGKHNGIFWQRRISTTRDGWDGYSTAHFYFEAAKGGHNYWNGAAGSKNSYYALGTSTVARTPGQTLGNAFETSNYSSGDTITGFFSERRYGGTLTMGDEGLKVLRIDGGSGDVIFTATIYSISGNTITFTSSAYAYTLGETRLLVNRNPDKKHTASCSVSLSAQPPTISCSNANLSDWYSGTGNKTNVCFELDSTKMNEFNRIVRVRSIQSQSQATLDLTYAGSDAIWDNGLVGVPSTGVATFSYCSPVTDSSQWNTGKLTVADASVFAANDRIEQNIGAEQNFTGIGVLYFPSIWPAVRTTMLSMTNVGSRMDGVPTVPVYSYITTGGARTGAPGAMYMWQHYNGTVKTGGINWHNESTTPPTLPWFFAWSDNTSGCEPMLGTFNSALTNPTATLQYCRDPQNADLRGWRMGALSVTEDGRIALSGFGYNSQPNKQFFLVSSGNNDNYYSYEGTGSSTGTAFKAVNHAWTTGWQVDHSGNSKHFGGATTRWYSDTGNAETVSVDGATGTGRFVKVCYNSAQTLCDYAGNGAPTNSCTTGSTYRRSDGGANSTFYVCEAGKWTAK